MTSRLCIGMLLLCVAAAAADGSDGASSSLERQRRSVERQMQAINRQMQGTRSALHTAEVPERASCGAVPVAAIAAIAEQTAARHGVSSALIRAVIQQESGGNACAVSPKGALGLMQIMPEVAQEVGLASPFDPVENANAGGRILKQLLTRFSGDLPLVLAAYNAGSGAVERAGGVPNYPETKQYVASILKALNWQ